MEDNVNARVWMDESIAMTQGLDSFSDGVETDDSFEVVVDAAANVNAGENVTNRSTTTNIEGTECDNVEQKNKVDTIEDILVMDLKGLSPHLIRKVDFSSLEVAYEFYSWYGIANGFSV